MNWQLSHYQPLVLTQIRGGKNWIAIGLSSRLPRSFFLLVFCSTENKISCENPVQCTTAEIIDIVECVSTDTHSGGHTRRYTTAVMNNNIKINQNNCGRKASMKRIIVSILALTLTFLLCACGGNSPARTPPVSPTQDLSEQNQDGQGNVFTLPLMNLQFRIPPWVVSVISIPLALAQPRAVLWATTIR